MTQTNIKHGDFQVLAGEDLTGKEDCLVKLTHDTGIGEVKLPAANSDYALYLLIEGAVLVLADVATAADKGKVRALPATSGTYRGLAIAEEAGVDGQTVLCRPAMLGNITVT